MTTETTQPATQFTAPDPGQIVEQTATVEALIALIKMFPSLPRPYVTIYASGTEGFNLQLDHPSHFEAWRTSLQLPTNPIRLSASGGSVWLDASGVFRGVPFSLSGFRVPLTREQAEAPQAVDEAPSAVAA
ncbi:hypothetical protein OG478_23045 [Streptomyces phaeochromogenes]|uniref:hypothetical protein n=1 Tax=Streptomyces phaeochromogenes TaxID=1923 RepID=UPI003866FDC2|nr:hypothetical protein OG478_23045 [Streptomyces phaeochromogenes]